MTEKIEPIEPDAEDVEAIERSYGPLCPTATAEERAYRYQLYQAAKIIREYWQQVAS